MTALACSGTMRRYKLETGMKKMQFLARVNDVEASATDREAKRPSEQKLKSIVTASGQLAFERAGRRANHVVAVAKPTAGAAGVDSTAQAASGLVLRASYASAPGMLRSLVIPMWAIMTVERPFARVRLGRRPLLP
jgi:hypothetical protein